jgi:carbon monoxide dehydrogenase subunit G
MLLEGKFALKVPIQKVWDTLLDPNTLLSCIPGAEKIERLDGKTYNCVVKQKVGSTSVKFKFKSVLTKVGAPKHLEFEGEGEDIGKAGHFVQKSVVDLKEIRGRSGDFL